MKIQDSEYQEELETAVEAAEKAGDIMDEYRKETIHIKETKTGATDFVTQADEDAQKAIVEKLKQNFPEDDFLGEEELVEENGSERTWIIDPVDGTYNFKTGHEYFCTSIALEKDEETKVAVVLSPESGLDQMFYAIKNEGAYVRKDNNHRELETSEREELSGGMLEVSMITRTNEERWELFLNLIEKLRNQKIKYLKQAASL